MFNSGLNGLLILKKDYIWNSFKTNVLLTNSLSFMAENKNDFNSSNPQFPKWEDVLYKLVKKYSKELDLPDDIYTDIKKKFNKIRFYNKLLSSNIPYIVIKMMEKYKYSYPKSTKNLEREIEKFRKAKNIQKNQFLTMYNSHVSDFIWIDKRIIDVLNIKKSNFSLNGLCAIEKTQNLYHPEDVKHVIRLGTTVYQIASIKSMNFKAMSDYYHVIFRVGRSNFKTKKGYNQSIKILDRKCFPVSISDGYAVNSTQHIDIWTATDYVDKFTNVEASIIKIGEPMWTQFFNSILYIFNAHILKIKPKDVLTLHYLSKFDQASDSLTEFNKDLQQFSVNKNIAFANDPFKNYNYKLNKKLTSVLLQYTMAPKNVNEIHTRRRVLKAKQLGLIELPEEIRLVILKETTV